MRAHGLIFPLALYDSFRNVVTVCSPTPLPPTGDTHFAMPRRAGSVTVSSVEGQRSQFYAVLREQLLEVSNRATSDYHGM